MIEFTLFKHESGQIMGFECRNHGKDIVCAAVSVLTQNAVNSVEAFSNTPFQLDYDPAGGFMVFRLMEKPDNNALLFLKSLELGIKGIKTEYAQEIEVFAKEV